MYISQAFKIQHDFWRYVVGTMVVIGVNLLGQFPFLIAILLKGDDSVLSMGNDPTAVLNILDKNTTLFFILLPFALSLIALFFIVKFLHKQSITSLTTSRKKIDWKRVFFAFGLWTIITIITIGADYYSSPENYQLNFKLVPFLILALIAFIFIPMQTSVEEYIFRGYLMQGIGTLTKNKWLPLVITSFTFGMLHIANPEVDKLGYIILVYYIGTGFFLGILTLMDEGMELALGFHAANNLISALLVTADWTAFQTHSVFKDISEPTAGFDVLIPILIVYPILLFIFAKKYKWSDWKEKLFGKVTPPTTTVIEEIGVQ
ncbi:CPBP family intramembrane metalloprotease [Flavobacteriaceae bacterium R38]|nr:CPBP family intramembrane metalloprotease [Flavobacteriaceae bacterium R38]